MGGRGGASGFSLNNGVIDQKAKQREIETIYRTARYSARASSYYEDAVLEAVDQGNGEVSFEYATPESREAQSKRTEYVTYKLKAGAVNGDIFGVNWDNVKSVSGQTYDMKESIKKRGFKWDGASKKWVKKQTFVILSWDFNDLLESFFYCYNRSNKRPEGVKWHTIRHTTIHTRCRHLHQWTGYSNYKPRTRWRKCQYRHRNSQTVELYG